MHNEISPNARIFRDVRIENCEIGELCCIGDDCDVVNSILQEKSELGRRNVIRNTTVGKGTYTGTNTIIKNCSIGRYCSIGWNVSIGGGNHNTNNVSMYTDYWYKRTFGLDIHSDKKNEFAEPVHIGNDVWIGAGVNVLNGINIGDGAVIGSGALVNKDVPPYGVVVGIPAQVIKYRFDFETIELLEKIKWWEWSEARIKENIYFLRNKPIKDELRKLID